jgi:hypothetical protein
VGFSVSSGAPLREIIVGLAVAALNPSGLELFETCSSVIKLIEDIFQS